MQLLSRTPDGLPEEALTQVFQVSPFLSIINIVHVNYAKGSPQRLFSRYSGGHVEAWDPGFLQDSSLLRTLMCTEVLQCM